MRAFPPYSTRTLSSRKAHTMDTREEGSLRPALASAFLTTCSNTKMPPVPISICFTFRDDALG